MAINGISGRPGSGKSYEAVIRQIMPALQAGRKVVTNIPLNVEWFCTYIGEHCRDLIVQIDGGFHNYGGKRYFSDAEHFLRYQEWRNDKNQGVLFVVDECHLSMRRLVATELKPEERQALLQQQKELKEYLSMHRHYGHDVILLTQNFRKVDRDIVDMIQTCYFTTKLSFLGKDDEYVCKVADGVTRNIVTTHRREYDKKYFGAYQSHTKSEGSVQEAESVDIPKWYQQWYNIGAMVMGVLFIFFLYTGFKEKPKPEPKPAQNTVPVQQQVASTPLASAQPSPQSPKAPEKPQEEPEPDLKHPYQGVQMHIVGNYSDFNRGRLQKVIWISISRNGQILTEITHADLALAGYEYSVLNDCLIDLRHGKFQQYVFCDSPTQAVSAPVVASAVTSDVSG